MWLKAFKSYTQSTITDILLFFFRLSVDYLSSNASVMNLLVISFDRYFSVTRPLTYRARRTTRKAALMIFSAWAISAIVWPPSIVAWPYIEGERTVPSNECYIQVLNWKKCESDFQV